MGWFCYRPAAAAWLLLFRVVAGCWEGGMTAEYCCDLRHGPEGNNACWDGQFNYQLCCATSNDAGKASPEVAALTIARDSMPLLPLVDGGHMPISGIGLCCRPTAKGDAVRQAVVDFLVMGGRNLDTASLYNNHREVGIGVSQAIGLGIPRAEIFLTTKIWTSEFGFESTTAWVDQILGELGLEYVDLVLLHSPKAPNGLPCGDARACRQETWLALQRARRNGKIKHLGVSNFGPRQMGELQALGGAPIVANQFEYHPFIPKVHRDTAEWCHQHGIVVTAYGSMGSAGMAAQLTTQDALQQMGARYGKSAGQVLLRWAVQKNVSVIPGTSNPKHMAENMRVFDFALAPEELAMLDNLPEDQQMLHFGHTPDDSP